MAAIERYREKSLKENRQSGNRKSGYRESCGQEVLATWNHEVRNPDKKEEVLSRGQLSVYRRIGDRHFASPGDKTSETLEVTNNER
jgi:hypothetical protein